MNTLFDHLTWNSPEDDINDPNKPTWAGQPIQPWHQFNHIPVSKQFKDIFDAFQPISAPQKPFETLIRSGNMQGEGYWRLGARPGDHAHKIYVGSQTEAGVFRVEPYRYEPQHPQQASSIRIFVATPRGIWVPIQPGLDGGIAVTEDMPYDRATGTYQNPTVFLMGQHPQYSDGMVLKHEIVGTYVTAPLHRARDGSADPLQLTGETAGSVDAIYMVEDYDGHMAKIIENSLAREKQWQATRTTQLNEDQSHHPYWRPEVDDQWINRVYEHHLMAPHV